MRRLLLLALLFIVPDSASALIWTMRPASSASAGPMCPLEGSALPSGPYLGSAFHNCQPRGPADAFSRCLAGVRLPNTPGAGISTSTACQYTNADALPALPPGFWVFSVSQCPAGEAAVCTRVQTSLRGGGGDTGCDDAGPICTAARRPALSVTMGCLVRADGTRRCKVMR
jgi:hypothetical protein